MEGSLSFRNKKFIDYKNYTTYSKYKNLNRLKSTIVKRKINMLVRSRSLLFFLGYLSFKNRLNANLGFFFNLKKEYSFTRTNHLGNSVISYLQSKFIGNYTQSNCLPKGSTYTKLIQNQSLTRNCYKNLLVSIGDLTNSETLSSLNQRKSVTSLNERSKVVSNTCIYRSSYILSQITGVGLEPNRSLTLRSNLTRSEPHSKCSLELPITSLTFSNTGSIFYFFLKKFKQNKVGLKFRKSQVSLQKRFNIGVVELIFFKNTLFFSNLIESFLYWRGFKKHKVLIYLLKRLFKFNKAKLLGIYNFSGLKCVLKGKLSSIGGAKKRKKVFFIGQTTTTDSLSSTYIKNFNFSTPTGVLNFKFLIN